MANLYLYRVYDTSGQRLGNLTAGRHISHMSGQGHETVWVEIRSNPLMWVRSPGDAPTTEAPPRALFQMRRLYRNTHREALVLILQTSTGKLPPRREWLSDEPLSGDREYDATMAQSLKV